MRRVRAPERRSVDANASLKWFQVALVAQPRLGGRPAFPFRNFSCTALCVSALWLERYATLLGDPWCTLSGCAAGLVLWRRDTAGLGWRARPTASSTVGHFSDGGLGPRLTKTQKKSSETQNFGTRVSNVPLERLTLTLEPKWLEPKWLSAEQHIARLRHLASKRSPLWCGFAQCTLASPKNSMEIEHKLTLTAISWTSTIFSNRPMCGERWSRMLSSWMKARSIVCRILSEMPSPTSHSRFTKQNDGVISMQH